MAGFAKIEDGRESCRCFDASIQSFQNVFEKIELRSRRQLVNDDDVKLVPSVLKKSYWLHPWIQGSRAERVAEAPPLLELSGRDSRFQTRAASVLKKSPSAHRS